MFAAPPPLSTPLAAHRDLASGKDLDDTVENVSGDVAWVDNRTLFYLTKVMIDGDATGSSRRQAGYAWLIGHHL